MSKNIVYVQEEQLRSKKITANTMDIAVLLN